ncbi:hypothetical protein LOTGIDRAFT_238699 [Lottia gigantea]|uniref:Glucocorticoid-induced transcript 1 protein n=1 Tax=Lottia gigantea TaxID=225164 RepID=V4CD03_LOTGI|nr:hypothetical protein LOTGIDRAFT_238699 [Lottia gigantea]ESO99794.1 hypothetical protein LOTGIDRAFT_238699 [Lottia gigantea]
MSGQPSQRVRRNASPSHTKTGPIKAVKAFSMKHGSPIRGLMCGSPTANVGTQKPWSRKSPDVRASPERRSPCSPSYKDKSKIRQSPIQPLKRTNSLDTLGPYLTGQWPKESNVNMYHHYQTSGVFMLDKSTQTTEELDAPSDHLKPKGQGHKRSSSLGKGDQQKKDQYIKQQIQQLRKKDKHSDSTKFRQSPVQGNHSALSLTAPPTVFANQSKAIIIPTMSYIPKQPMSRYQRNSVEGLSVEIEKLWSKEVHYQCDSDEIETFREVPDGHRAPVPEVQRITCLMRNVDTQTPSSKNEDGIRGSNSSRCDSISPAINSNFLGPIDLSQPSSRSLSSECKSEKEIFEESPEPSYPSSPRLEKFLASPKLKDSYNFVREPPDGCEKVKAIEEFRQTPEKEPSFFCPVKPNQFVFKASIGSAFFKPYTALTSNTVTSIET